MMVIIWNITIPDAENCEALRLITSWLRSQLGSLRLGALFTPSSVLLAKRERNFGTESEKTKHCQIIYHLIYVIETYPHQLLHVGRCNKIWPQGHHSNTFMCCHPQASDYRSTPKHGYLEYEIMTLYHRFIHWPSAITCIIPRKVPF